MKTEEYLIAQYKLLTTGVEHTIGLAGVIQFKVNVYWGEDGLEPAIQITEYVLSPTVVDLFQDSAIEELKLKAYFLKHYTEILTAFQADITLFHAQASDWGMLNHSDADEFYNIHA